MPRRRRPPGALTLNLPPKSRQVLTQSRCSILFAFPLVVWPFLGPEITLINVEKRLGGRWSLAAHLRRFPPPAL